MTEVYTVWKGVVHDQAGKVGWHYQTGYQTEEFVILLAVGQDLALKR